VPLFTTGGLGLDLKNLVLFTSLVYIIYLSISSVHYPRRLYTLYT